MDGTSMESELRNKKLKREYPRDFETNKQSSYSAKKPKPNNLPLKLTDVNNYCLKKIFIHLSIEDLVNLVEYDARLSSACRDVFSKKFRKETIKVSNQFDPKVEATPWSVKLLNHFGEMIVKLNVEYSTLHRRFSQILDDAIILNCRKTVSKIRIENPDFFTMSGLEEPFDFVNEVEFSEGCMCDLITDFRKWFPNAKALRLKNYKGTPDDCEMEKYHNQILNKFPALHQFEISNCDVTCQCHVHCGEKIENEGLEDFFQKNSQLKSLSVSESGSCDEELCNYIDINCYFMNAIKQYLPSLEKLSLTFKQKTLHNDQFPVSFESLKELSICYKRKVYEIQAPNIRILNVSSDSLVRCSNIILMSKQLKVVNISGTWTRHEDVVDMIKVVANLPHLYELNVPLDEKHMKLEQVIELLTRCKKLIKLIVCSVYHTASIYSTYRTQAELDQHFNNATKMAKAGWKVTKKIEYENGCHYEFKYLLLFEKCM